MHKSNLKARLSLAGSAAVLMAGLTLADDAQASGFQLKEQGGDGLGRAFAGSAAVANDLSTIFFNPAGMAYLSGNQASVDASYIRPTAEFNIATTDTTGGDGGDAGDNGAIVPVAYGMIRLFR